MLTRSGLIATLGLVLLTPFLHADTDRVISRIAFGSCAHQDKPQPIWKAILAQKPELFLALGDNIYGDTDDMVLLRKKYEQAGAIPEYQQLTKTCPILAIWDDHDYGKNDAGVEYPKKDESQQLFLDFYGVAKDSPRRMQKGIYHAEIFGTPGKRIQIILLDGRYFRSPMKRGKREPGMTYTPYIPNTDPDATILGADQWKWLEEQLKKPAEVRLLVSGIQVVAEDHGFEKWMNFPAEREKLFKLIKDCKASGVICLSGDRHLAELSMMTDAVSYPLYDLTSSGLNQASKTWRPLEKNRHRVGTMGFGDNFGMVTVDWSGDDPKIALQIRDVDGDLVIQQKLLLSMLQPGATNAPKREAKSDQPKPSEGAISPADAFAKVGQNVVVEMKVYSVGMAKSGKIFLNSEKNFRDKNNFTIVLEKAAQTGKYAKATPEMFKDRVIRVSGTVSEFQGNPQILVTESKQLTILEK